MSRDSLLDKIRARSKVIGIKGEKKAEDGEGSPDPQPIGTETTALDRNPPSVPVEFDSDGAFC